MTLLNPHRKKFSRPKGAGAKSKAKGIASKEQRIAEHEAKMAADAGLGAYQHHWVEAQELRKQMAARLRLATAPCPECERLLLVRPGDTIIRCPYCDALVEVQR